MSPIERYRCTPFGPGDGPVLQQLDYPTPRATRPGLLLLSVGLFLVPGRVSVGLGERPRRGRVAVIVLGFVASGMPLPRPAWAGGGPGPGPTPPVFAAYFVHADHLGSTLALTRFEPGGGTQNGQIVRRYRYDAYGKPAAYTAAGTAIGTGTALSSGSITPLRTRAALHRPALGLAGRAALLRGALLRPASGELPDT
jgi:hypothetical protein